MNVVSVTGNDTVIINGRIFNDFSTGDVAKLEYGTDIMVAKPGKNGNTIYSLNAAGELVSFEIRLIRGGSDDQFLNNLLTQMKQNAPGFTLLTGELIKNVGDGQGNITQDIYNLVGGVFNKNVGAKENVEGDTEQALVTYFMHFALATRTIG